MSLHPDEVSVLGITLRRVGSGLLLWSHPLLLAAHVPEQETPLFATPESRGWRLTLLTLRKEDSLGSSRVTVWGATLPVAEELLKAEIAVALRDAGWESLLGCAGFVRKGS